VIETQDSDSPESVMSMNLGFISFSVSYFSHSCFALKRLSQGHHLLTFSMALVTWQFSQPGTMIHRRFRESSTNTTSMNEIGGNIHIKWEMHLDKIQATSIK
jgi:hypothetical protein